MVHRTAQEYTNFFQPVVADPEVGRPRIDCNGSIKRSVLSSGVI